MTKEYDHSNPPPRKQWLKAGLIVLGVILTISWTAYRGFRSSPEPYHDFTIDAVVSWLENADRRQFPVCGRNITDNNGWFEWFIKDRNSLGNMKSRQLALRRELSTRAEGMRRYELNFDLQFGKKQSIPDQLTERVIVESDGTEKISVVRVDYWYSGFLGRPETRPATDDETTSVMSVVNHVLEQMDAGNTAFFQQQYKECLKKPDYFGMGHFIRQELKTPQRIKEICELLHHNQRSLLGVEFMMFPGRTGVEIGTANYKFAAKKNGLSEDYVLQIMVSRDHYQDQSASWEFAHVFVRPAKFN